MQKYIFSFLQLIMIFSLSVNRDVMCLVMDPNIAFDDLCDDLRDLCKFNSDDPFTMKWIDEEGNMFGT